MTSYILSLELGQATLEYLASKPYKEVFQIISGFQNLKLYEVTEHVKEDTSIVEKF